MSKILQFPSEPDFEFSVPRANTVPEGAVVFAGLALTAWLPTIMWCAALNATTPADLIAPMELIGAIAGCVLYRCPAPSPPRCVPISNVPEVYPKLPKAA